MTAGSIGQQIINGTYGLDNRPPTAYEELKAWCEKHLPKDGYSIFTPVGDKTLTAIYITDDAISTNFYFKKDTGEYYGGEYA